MVATGVLGSTSAAAAAPQAQYSEAELQQVKDALDSDSTIRIPGTAWGVDTETDRLLVSYDDSVTSDELSALRSAAEPYGDAVRFEHLTGLLEPADSRTVGGNAIFGGSTRCSLGFNAIRSGVYYFLTAGHCTRDANYWYDNDGTTLLGYRVTTVYGPKDYGVVRYTNTTIAKYGAVDNYNGTYQDITTSRWAQGDEFVCRSGSTTGKRCGYISGLCSTVTYNDGTRLECMIRATACAAKGDSGGPMYSGRAALGIFSGGRLGCSTYPNGPTYYNSAHGVLQHHGLAVY